MIRGLRRLLAAATSLFFLLFTVAAASGNPNVPIALSDVSTPHPNSTVCGAVIPNTAHNEHGRPYGSNTTVSLSELVQVADSRWPEGGKMKAIKWTGRATLEVNMFSDTINTCGNLTGSKIYNAVWQTLNDQCPERIGNNDFPSCWGDSTPLPIRHKTKDTDGSYRYSYCQLRVISSKFGTPEARKPMFGALAASYEAMTSNDMNCFTVKDNESNNRYCNVAVQASVFAEDSHIYMSLSSDISQHQRPEDMNGDWKCCETREYVDSKLDTGDVERFKKLYPKPRSMLRNVECHRGCTNDQRMTTMDVDKRLVHVIDYEFF